VRAVVLIVFALSFVFTTSSLLARHFNFKSTAYDTGIQAGVARNIAFHGSFYNEVMDVNHLSDHFAPALALPGLLFYLWDNAAVMFIFQNLCVFLSIIVAFFLAREILKNELQALMLAFFYSVNYYLTAVNTVDYHIDTLALPLLLTLLLLVEKRQTAKNLILIGVLSLAMLTIKEDFPLTLAGLGMFVLVFKKGKRTGGLIMFLVGGIGFYLILAYFMPKAAGNEYVHINYYSGLGKDTAEVIKNILTRPDIVIKNLISPPEKLFRPILLVFTFMLLPIFAPLELLSAGVPIFYQLVSSYRHQYMFHSHYAIPALPFLFYSSIYGFVRVKKLLERMHVDGRLLLRKIVIVSGAFLLLFSTISTVSAYARNIARYDGGLYATFENEVKPLIPKSSRVMSSNELEPQFIGYAGSRRFWRPEDLASKPDYLVLYLRKNSLPWPQSEYRNFIIEMKKDYTVCFENQDFLVIKFPKPSIGK